MNTETYKCEKEAEIAIIATKIEEIHKVLIGNGQPGMVAEFNQAKGVVKFLTWFCGVTGITGLIALIRTFMNG